MALTVSRTGVLAMPGLAEEFGLAPGQPPDPGTPWHRRAWAWVRRQGRLEIALAISLLLHVGVLTFRFVDPDRFERVFRDTPLDVILVNAKAKQPPTKAQAIAQSSLAGGGDAERGRATSPLAAMAQDVDGDASTDSQKRVEQLFRQQQQLLAQVRRDLSLMPPPDPARDQGTPEAREQEEHRRQLLKLLAEIEKRINEENARPRRRYISPATREEAYALYYDRLRRRIEERGTKDFPEAQGKKLYGELMMNLSVDAAGRLLEAEVLRSSGNKLLDRRAVAIVRAAAPFGQFNAEMRRQADEIIVTSRFRFTRDDAMEAAMSDGTR